MRSAWKPRNYARINDFIKEKHNNERKIADRVQSVAARTSTVANKLFIIRNR